MKKTKAKSKAQIEYLESIGKSCFTCIHKWFGNPDKTATYAQWYCMLKKPVMIGDDKALKVKTCKEWKK